MGVFKNLASLRGIAVALSATWLSACGSDAARYAIGGTASGLAGTGLVLANNNADNLPVSASGAFTFATELTSGTSYAVTVKVQPSGQVCAVANGTGNVGTAAVTNVVVTCTTAAPMTLLSAAPANAAPNVSRLIAPSMTFSADLSAQTAISSNVTLQSAAGSHALTTSVSGTTLSITPDIKLLPLTTYALTAGTGLRGAAGEQLPDAATTTFTTADGAWQASGPLAPDTADHTFDPRIATSTNGSAVAVWRQSDGSRMRMMSRHFTASAGWGATSTIDTGSAFAPADDLVMDAAGNAIVVWQEAESASCGEDSSCSRYKLWISRFVPNEGWGKPKSIASAVAGRDMDPKIAMTSQGDAVLVWTENDGTRANIWAKRFTVDDGWRSSAKIETESGAAYEAQVAVDDSGNAIAIWQQRDGLGEDVWANRYSSTGGWGAAVRIESDNMESGVHPEIAMNGSGNALAVWQQYDGTSYNIWSNTFSVGAGWGVAERVTTNIEIASNFKVAMDAGGNSILVWEELYHESPAAFRTNIWANRRLANAGWDAPTLMGNTSVADPVQVVADKSGNAIAVWSQQEPEGRSSIWANRYIANAGWSTAALIETDDAGDANMPVLAMDSSGDVTVLWHQFDGPPFSGARLRAFYRRFD